MEITPTAAELADPRAAHAWKAAQDFEAMTISQMLTPMFQTVDLSSGPFGGKEGEAAMQPFLVDAIGKKIAASGGFGLAMPVWQQMLKMQEKHS
jgi:Rod binding domain-containing protein